MKSFILPINIAASMELSMIEKSKDSITIGIKDPDMTLITPLLNELLRDEAVSDVTFTDKHPELASPTLTVSVTSGKPQTALKRASKAASNQYKEAKDRLVKQLK
jgi:DNA-directed RNA polymerase subunit L